MPIFKAPDNSLHELSQRDVEQGGLAYLPLGCVQITGEEVATLRAKPLVDRKSAAWERIKQERDRRTEHGGFCVSGKWYHSDQKSRSQQLGLVLLGAGIPANLQWKTMDGSFVLMSQGLAQQILAAAAASDTAIFSVAEAHKSAMELSPDPDLYDFSAGWPPVYSGV